MPVGRIWVVVRGTPSVSGQSVPVEGLSKIVAVSVVYSNITHILDIRKNASRTYALLENTVVKLLILQHVFFQFLSRFLCSGLHEIGVSFYCSSK